MIWNYSNKLMTEENNNIKIEVKTSINKKWKKNKKDKIIVLCWFNIFLSNIIYPKNNL